MTAAVRPVMEAWEFAMRAVLVAVCVGSFVVTMTTLVIRTQQSGFLGGPAADAPTSYPDAPPPMNARDSAIAAHPFSKLVPNDPPPPGVDTRSGLANGLLLGALAGVFASGLTAWTLLGPLTSLYRRGSLTLTASIGTLVGMMLAVPFDMIGRQPGLILFAAILAFIAWRIRRGMLGADVVEPAPAA